MAEMTDKERLIMMKVDGLLDRIIADKNEVHCLKLELDDPNEWDYLVETLELKAMKELKKEFESVVYGVQFAD